MLPNFLIVGAAKSGTTSMYHYLSQHPDIFMPKWKELSFLIGDPFGPLHQVKKPQYYHKVFSKVQNQSAVGEASTSYLYDQAAPQRIKEILGKIKILVILRNPVDMSYSLYNHQVRRAGETLKTFETALEAETKRLKDPNFKKNCYGWHANYYYFQRGLYFEQVKRYLDTFGKDNVLVFLFEELVADAVRAAQKTYRFLGVDDAFVPAVRVHNPAGSILSIPRFWEDTGLFLKTASFLFSKNLINKIPHLLRNIGRKLPPPINPVTSQRLAARFHDDICRVEQLIEKDLSHWKINPAHDMASP
ncbi:MAG: sulfotransferase domain-containing protein [Deltaproteobacteria bacterium]|nr:sulfotransferase domain-containing protein [Deltaproteobacteria bacterium]